MLQAYISNGNQHILKSDKQENGIIITKRQYSVKNKNLQIYDEKCTLKTN